MYTLPNNGTDYTFCYVGSPLTSETLPVTLGTSVQTTFSGGQNAYLNEFLCSISDEHEINVHGKAHMLVYHTVKETHDLGNYAMRTSHIRLRRHTNGDVKV